MNESELTPEGSRFRLPSQPCVVTVTPDMASDWLSYRNHPKNRPLSKMVAGKYQADMESGRWREGTPEGLIFDTDGRIISGQHRLKAVANGGMSFQFWIFPNESRDIFDVVDQGYRRTAAHVLRVPHATSVANGARYLAALTSGGQRSLLRYSRVTTPEIVETFRAWPELSWYPREAFAAYAAARIPIGVHLAVLAQAARTAQRDLIPVWLTALSTGADLGARNPALVLREKFRAGVIIPPGVNRHELHYALIVKAWNAWVHAQTLGVLRWSRDESLPVVAGTPTA